MESPASPRVYPPVGCCIYCGTAAGELTKEHIVPLGLGGNLILPKASCRVCAAITGDVERFCLRPMLGPFRIRLTLPTRRPQERPARLPLEFIRVDGRREQETVGAQEVPLACIGFRLAAPGLLRGLPPNETFEGELVVRHLENNTRKRLSPEGQRVKLGTINMLTFSRMLAKIAHSYGVCPGRHSSIRVCGNAKVSRRGRRDDQALRSGGPDPMVASRRLTNHCSGPAARAAERWRYMSEHCCPNWL